MAERSSIAMLFNVIVPCKADKSILVYRVFVACPAGTNLVLVVGRLIQDGGEGPCKVSRS